MKKNTILITSLLLALLFTGCTKLQYDDVSFVETAVAPAKLSAMFNITQDNTGLVTIYPNGEGVAYYNVYFGDGTAAPVKVMAGESVQRKYAEGNYDVRVVGVGITGKTAEAIQKLTVSFKAPENMEVTTSVDPSSAFMINVSAKALYETLFKITWGDVPNEVPASFLEGETVKHTYAKSGDYTITVVALSGGVATTTVTKKITIKVPIVLPLDFETVGQTYSFVNFGGGDASVIANPKPGTINTSSKVGKMVKNAPEVWGGSLIGLSSPIDFSVNKIMRLKVYSPRVGAKVLLKVENSANSGQNYEKEVTTSIANAWEDLVFDYSGINASNTYDRIVLIFELGSMGDGSSNYTFYFDDIRLTNTFPVQLPLNFEYPITYGWFDFDGGNVTVAANPSVAGINTSAKVAKMVKNAGQVWGGSFLTLDGPINFALSRSLRMKVYSPRAGAKVLLKVENSANSGQNFEREVVIPNGNAWQELSFDFTGINTANPYDRVVIIFDLGVMGDGSPNFTYYFDDIRLN